MSDINSNSVSELRKMLIESGKYTEEQAEAIKGKSNLVKAVLEITGDSEKDEQEDDVFSKLLSSVEKPDAWTNIEDKEIEPKTGPDYNSVAWHDYAMSHFDESEKDDGYPTLYGLRRVAELLLGSIIQSGPTQLMPPTSETAPGRSSCVYTVVFDWQDSGIERAFSAAGGAYSGNTDESYCIYPEAIAESRAEARALRKALKLKTMAAEEAPKNKRQSVEVEKVTTPEWNADEPITSVQQMFITQKCKEMEIDLTKFVETIGKKQLGELTKGEGKTSIELLNKYQNKTKDRIEIPVELKLTKGK